MADEPEVIKQQMLETRAALTEKLETLEQQVVGTVQSATTAVADTVESVKEAVQCTVERAKESVHDTVEAVKDTFDLPRHVQEHPWIAVSGSVVLGYLGGCLLHRAGSNRPCAESASSLSTLAARSEPGRDGGVQPYRAGEEALSTKAVSAPAPVAAEPGVLGQLGQKFEPEIDQLKGLAIGTVLGLVRDLITKSAPEQLSSPLADIINSVTVKLGGRPIRGPVSDMFGHSCRGQREAQGRDSAPETRPMAATHAWTAGAVDRVG